jgi:hypothetical protein
MTAEFLFGFLFGGFLAGVFAFLLGIVLGYQAAVAKCARTGIDLIIGDKLRAARPGEVVAFEFYASVINDDDDDEDGCGEEEPFPFDSRIMNN